MRQLSDKGKALIQSFERCRLKSYHGDADAPGVYTIGWGHVLTGHEVPDLFRPGDMPKDVVITQQQADDLFDNDIKSRIKAVSMKAKVDLLNQDQFDAVMSFIYNVGLGQFMDSSLYRLLSTEMIDDMVGGFSRFIRSGGEYRNGLIRRRAAETALFKGDYGQMDYFMENSSPKTINDAKKYIGRTDV